MHFRPRRNTDIEVRYDNFRLLRVNGTLHGIPVDSERVKYRQGGYQGLKKSRLSEYNMNTGEDQSMIRHLFHQCLIIFLFDISEYT